MPYTAAELVALYTLQNAGAGPDAATALTLQDLANKNATGALTDTQVRSAIIQTGDNDTAVAVLSYQFFTGTAPTKAGVEHLVSSPANTTDLNDPYYGQFNLENRYINFASNLGINGEGGAAFSSVYGGLSIAQAIDAAYEQIIGTAYATAAGINATAAKADILARLPYFTALANANFPTGTGALKDLAIKTAIVGYIMAEGMKADVGVYASAMNNYSMAVLQGNAVYNANLVTTYAQPAGQTSPVGTIIAPGTQGSGIAPTPGTGGGGGGGGDPTRIDLGPGPSTFTLAASDQTAYTYTGGSGGAIVLSAAGSNASNTVTLGDGGGHTVSLGTGANTVTTGSGGDLLIFANGLNAASKIDGAGGADTLRVGGTTADAAFAAVSNVETLDLAAGANVTLAATAIGKGFTTVTNATNGGFKLDISGGVANFTVTGGAGDDTVLAGANLTAADTLDGAGGTKDVLGVGGTTGDGAFAAVSNFEILDLAAAANVTLAATAVGKGLTTVTNTAGGGVTLDVSGAAANYTITGGGGTNSFVFGATLDNNDTVTGGAGADTIKTTGAVVDAAFTKVTGVETIDVGAAGSVTLDTKADGSGLVNVTNTANGGFTVTTNAGYTKALTVTAGTGADNITGGAAGDTFNFGANLTAGDTINGDAGSDTLNITGTGTGSGAITNIETIKVTNTSGGSITFTTGAITAAAGGTTITAKDSTSAVVIDATAAVAGGGNPLTIVDGAGDDTISAPNNDARRGSTTVTLSTGGADTVTIANGAFNGTTTNALTINNFTGGAGGGFDKVGGLGITTYEQVAAAGTGVTAANSIVEIETGAGTITAATANDAGVAETAIDAALTTYGGADGTSFYTVIYGSGGVAGNAYLYQVNVTTAATGITAANVAVELVGVFNGLTADSIVAGNFI